MAGEKLFNKVGRFKVSKATAGPEGSSPRRFSYKTVGSDAAVLVGFAAGVAEGVLILGLLFFAILKASFGIVNHLLLTERLDA
jgi:hypothetical protein